MNFLKIYLAFMVLVAFSCKPPITVTQKKQSDAVEGVLRYALPQNKVLVKVKITRDSLTPGPYSDPVEYKDILYNLYYRMGLDSSYIKTKKTSVSYKIETITLADTFFVDTNAIYEIAYSKKLNRKTSFTASTSGRSIIKGIKQENSDKTLQIASEIIGATASTFLAVLGDEDLITSLMQKNSIVSIDNLKRSFDKANLSDDNLRAILSASQLISVNNDIAALMSNKEIAKDMREGPLYESVLKTLKGKKDELSPLFLYKKTTKTFNLVFAIDFSQDTTGKRTLFSFDSKNGIEITGTGLMPSDTIGLKVGSLGSKKEEYTYSFKPTNEKIINENVKFTPKDSGKVEGGLVYRIPLSVDLEIKKQGKYYMDKTSQISQLGTLVTLPKRLNTADITFIENTGSISSLSFGSENLNKDDIKSAGDNASKAAGLYKSDLEKKKEELERLKIEKELKELKQPKEGGS